MGWTGKVGQEPRVARSAKLKSSAQQPCAGGLCCGTHPASGRGSPRLPGENTALGQGTQETSFGH